MLVLSRKQNEVIRIADDVSVTVVEIRGDRVLIGIDAPREIAVDRDEVRRAKRADGKLATESTESTEKKIG